LTLKEIEGNSIENKSIMLNAGGLLVSQHSDGVTYFGPNPRINDIVLRLGEDYVSDSPIYFAVIFYTTYKRYFLSNESSENMFIRVKKYTVEDKSYFLLGDYQFEMEVDKQNQSLRISHGYSQGNQSTKIFTTEKNKIIVGRKRDCDIILDNMTFARYQFTIELENNKWVIKEGDVSQYGLFVLLESKSQIEIMNNMKFKLRNCLYEFEYIK